jgi:hypothetical protein
MFNSFIEFAEIGFDFLLVNSLFHALWSNLEISLLLLILQYLVGDVRIQHDTCGQFELGMQLSL